MPPPRPPALRVAAIFVHPVKSCAAVAVGAAAVGDRGLEGDRRFMIVDAAGGFVTQRDEPRLALVAATVEEEALVLDASRLAAGVAPLRLPARPAGPTTKVQVWGDDVLAVDAGVEAAAWLAATVKEGLRLVWMPEGARRPVDDDRPDGAIVSFADGYPYLVTSVASLAAVEARAPGTGVARRFRPNLVLDGLGPFEEDELAGVTIGDVRFDFVKPCSRCTVVNVDPESAQVGKEPLASLSTFRKQGNKVMFGQNAIAIGSGRIAVGDLATRR